jgi:hypothetical protein
MKTVGPCRTLALGAAAVLVAACGGADSGIVTHTDPQRLSRFDAPRHWHTYDFTELSSLDDLPFDEPVQGFSFPAVTSLGFDGAPVKDVSHLTLTLPEADYPIGAASVRQIGDRERDFLSRAILTQSIVPYFGLPNPQELQKEDFTFGDGFDGIRLLVSFQSQNSSDQGVAYLISVSDPEDTRIYAIVAGCSRDCFIANQDEITKVVDSWLVNKKA